jgi:hypothetical protein
MSSGIAVAFLIAPASYHRLNLRRGVDEKEEMLLTSSKLAIVGTAFLALGIGCSLFVIADALFGPLLAAFFAGLILVLIALLWYGLPLWRRRSGPRKAS